MPPARHFICYRQREPTSLRRAASDTATSLFWAKVFHFPSLPPQFAITMASLRSGNSAHRYILCWWLHTNDKATTISSSFSHSSFRRDIHCWNEPHEAFIKLFFLYHVLPNGGRFSRNDFRGYFDLFATFWNIAISRCWGEPTGFRKSREL